MNFDFTGSLLRFSVHDATGKEVFTRTKSDDFQLDISEYVKGGYFYQVVFEKGAVGAMPLN